MDWTHSILVTIAILSTAGACLVPLFLRRGLMKVLLSKKEEMNSPRRAASVSIIIAAHNEEVNIKNCLDAIARQNYPHDKFEIMIVDDRSTDKTAEILRTYSDRLKNLKVITIHQTPVGFALKKYAIDQGIKYAAHEILLFTDADCEPEQHWISAMIKYFTDEVGVVLGYSPIRKTSGLLNALSMYETTRTAAMMFGFAGNEIPYMAVGRNWAYRKQAYIDAGGMTSIQSYLSGDDDLLLQQIRKKTSWKIRCCVESGSFVRTNSKIDLRSFVKQKMRHSSASAHYSLQSKFILGAAQLLSICSIISSCFSGFIMSPYFFVTPCVPLALMQMNLRALTKLHSNNEHTSMMFDFLSIFINEPVYLLFSSIVGLMGFLSKPKWS